MRIRKMELSNFKKHGNLEVLFGDNSTVISGENESGKSTIYDAYYWCFFGSVANGSSDANAVKPIRNGVTVHGVETIVSVDIDGVVFGRTLKEKWVKKRGNAERVFDGHTTVYEIDDVPVKKKDFDVKIAEVFGDVKRFEVLSNIKEFISLHWKKRREMLIADTSVLDALTEQLVSVKATRKKLQKEVEELPVRIDEASNYEDVAFDSEKYGEIKVALDDSKGKLSSLKAGSSIDTLLAPLVKKLADNEALTSREVYDKITKYKEESNEEYIRLRKVAEDLVAEDTRKWNEHKNDLDMFSTKKSDYEFRKGTLEKEKTQLGEQIEKLRKSWSAENSKSYEPVNVCPNCSHDLSEGAEERFNILKAETLSSIVASADDCKAMLQRTVDSLSELVEPVLPSIDNVEPPVIDYSEAVGFFENSRAYAKQLEVKTEEQVGRIVAIEDEIKAVKDSFQTADTTQLEKEIEVLTDELQYLETEKEKHSHSQLMEKRARELQDLLKEKSKTLASYELQEFKIEDEIKVIIEEVEREVGKNFELTSFKMFETQVNGGIKDICTPTVKGISYENLNTAMQINVGIDIINGLTKIFGVKEPLPIWVDGSESVNVLHKSLGQMIEMQVSPIGTPLKIETK